MKKNISTEEDYWVFFNAKFFFFLVVEMPLWSLNTQINLKNMHSMQCYLHRIPIISSFSVLHISFWFWLVLCFVELDTLVVYMLLKMKLYRKYSEWPAYSLGSLSLSPPHTHANTHRLAYWTWRMRTSWSKWWRQLKLIFRWAYLAWIGCDYTSSVWNAPGSLMRSKCLYIL